MENAKPNSENIHPNTYFVNFVRKLSPNQRKKLRGILQENIAGFNQNHLKNWINQQARIPPYLYKELNKAAKEIIKDWLVCFVPELAEHEIILNLFNTENMADKTTIFYERAKRRWTQENLAKEAGVSVPTIQKIENQRGKSILHTTAVKIAKAFDLQTTDFEEFSEAAK